MGEQSATEHAAETAARSDAFDIELDGQPPAPVFVGVPAKNYTRRAVVDSLFGLVIAFLLVGLVLDRKDQRADERQADEQRAQIVLANERLLECTTPGEGHDCFNEGQARTAEAILLIVDANHNGCPDVIEILNLLDPAHPQACGPPPTTTTTAPPSSSGSPPTTANRPPPTDPPRTTTTVRRPPNRRHG